MSTQSFMKRSERSGQSMVEFALVLPILLLVVLGLIEAGRLVFIYASTTTASREAVRYASATGTGINGIPRYQDCAGIKSEAQRVGFLADLQPGDIQINYYNAAGGLYDTCTGAADLAVTIDNNYRVEVIVTANYAPIVPIPFVPFTNFPIVTSSRRTMIATITIAATPGAGGGGGPAPTATHTPVPPTATNTATHTPIFSPTPSNTPTITRTPTVTFTPTVTSTPTQTFTPSPTFTPTNTATATATPLACVPRHNGLKTSPFGMTIFNQSNTTLTIKEIQVFYNSSRPGNQRITSIILGGVTVWGPGSRAGSPALFNSFVNDVSISPGGSKLITITFSKNLHLNGTERILITFNENGCPVLDSSNNAQRQ